MRQGRKSEEVSITMISAYLYNCTKFVFYHRILLLLLFMIRNTYFMHSSPFQDLIVFVTLLARQYNNPFR
uniref:Uncharacterized protein n=1 Tax=Populus trichocarpa TaxID=3694 RepID=A0A2K1Y666_POPTR